MDSHKENDSDESTPAPDTSHLASKAKRSKKSSTKKVVLILVVLVVVVGAIVGGILYYNKTQDDKKASDAAAAAAAAAKTKPLTPEQQITASLTDSVQKQIDALKQDDGKAVIENSTAAAQQVGRNLDETNLKD